MKIWIILKYVLTDKNNLYLLTNNKPLCIIQLQAKTRYYQISTINLSKEGITNGNKKDRC